MRFELKTTSDGSLTVYDAEVGECFKSQHAASTEVEAVFIQPAIRENPFWGRLKKPFRVLELGFGLGTNFCRLAEENFALEFLSVERDLAGAKFFAEQSNSPLPLKQILSGEESFGNLKAKIIQGDFFEVIPSLNGSFHAIFFDPFSPKSNPEAWTEKLFSLCFQKLYDGGRLVTYSVSREAKDAATTAGFHIEKRKLPEVLNKRGALLATKPPSPLE